MFTAVVAKFTSKKPGDSGKFMFVCPLVSDLDSVSALEIAESECRKNYSSSYPLFEFQGHIAQWSTRPEWFNFGPEI